uniref:Intraflagellar transport 25 n=1 Tax=Ovis aries TaxID=9940 RepID=A0AC11CRY8_SHEEP
MRKVDLCLSSEGTEVILATSSDEKHPPENMIDGNPETFWTTTGMFPQEFIICFHKHVRIEKLVIQSYFVRTLRIEKSTSKEPVDFEQWIERDLVHTEGQLQNEEILEPLIPGSGRFPGGGMATHSSILAWKKIPWTEEAGGLQSLGSHRIKYCGETKQPCLPRTVLSCALYPLLHSYLSPVSSYKLTPVSVSGFGRMSLLSCVFLHLPA